MNVVSFALNAMTYCMRTRASVTRWGSTPAHQAQLDAKVKYSPHVFWLAVDVVYDGAPPDDGEIIAARLGLWLERKPDHDHLQPLEWKAG